jgi:DNA mismatch repair protein MutS
MSIVQDYLELTRQYQAEYGAKTIVLMEVGSFYEVYALIKTDGTYTGSPIEEFAKINEMVIAKKSNVFVDKQQVAMAGMGTAHAEKYIQKLQDHDYTIVIYKQDPTNKTSRNLAEIISPGTYFPVDSIKLTNNIMCIWLHKAKATKTQPCQVTMGLANLDIYTGKTALCQFQTVYAHSPATYDELERSIAAYRPSECLLVANLPETLLDDIIGFVGLEQTKIHKIDLNAPAPAKGMAAGVKNAEKQVYQMAILKKFFPHLSTFHEMLPTHSIALQAFCFLLDFVDQHNPQLATKLNEPVFENYTDRLLLANHSLNQLNILDDARHTGRLRSVSALLNNCATTMGQRQFMYHLHYPTTHMPTLQASYDITAHVLAAGEPYFLGMRTHLSAISDLEKFTRKIITGKVQPKNFTTLGDDLTHLAALYTQYQTDAVLLNYLAFKSDLAALCREIKTDMERVFDLEVCRNLTELDDSVCIIQRGISPVVDHLVKTSQEGGDKLQAIATYLSALIQQTEKKAATYVKIHETAKHPATLVGTSRRIALLKAALKTQPQTMSLTFTSNYSSQVESFEFDLSALEYTNSGSSKTEQVITSQEIRQLTGANEENKIKLLKEMQRVFQNYLKEFAKFEPALATLIQYATAMDLIQCKAYTAHKYNYCSPVLNAAAPKAYFEFTGIRHPLIEHLQTTELYVTNDLTLGHSAAETATGILLYGTNAVGKTSFIKSVGIALIMAQAGLYVPCNTFVFQPYKTIFTRILGNDNLFKGLSTFAVEMTELRTILTLADADSLVLGDELCSGTESDSALSIFTAGLEILHAKKSTFLFATHFHEINTYEEITALKKLKMLHMAVHYNKETDLLVYDRKLREGPGESMYGLEVCKSLNLPEAFLERAHAIRMKYHPTTQNVLSLTATHFNAKKLVGNCELCQQNKASEVHHLQHQKNARPQNDYIVNSAGQNFHKNHVANLLNICQACHKKIHQTHAEHKVVKTTKGYVLSKL